jgi:UDP-N-acetylmuramyl pentapeptide phosphotransferase/UDP-N-acetylglucosamine-1-phosphate transferase
MALRAAVAFSASGVAALLIGALLRSIARRRSTNWPRTLGGAVLAVAVPIGLAAATALPTRAAVVAGGALVLAALGAVRDQVRVPAWLHVAVLVGVAVAVAASGLRFPLGGVPAVDFAWTVVWLTAVTSAVANSGNADGQFPRFAAASLVGILVLAAFAGQSAAAGYSAALLGALLGLLAYNLRPASLFVGRAGALLVGFTVAAGALWAQPSIGRPGSLLVSVLLVAVALLDGLVVVLSRLRRGRSLRVRLRDHLSHRLVAAGLRPSGMINLLSIVQLTLSVLAVFVGRGLISIPVGGAAGALVLLVLGAAAMRARMRDPQAPGFSWRVRLVCLGLFVFVVLASGVAAASALTSRTRLLAARDAASAAIRAASDGKSAQALVLFARAEREFAAADDRLGSFLNVPSLVIPVVGSNMHAARELTRVGLELSRAGHELTQKINSDELRVVDGRIPLDRVAAIAPDLDDAAEILTESADAVDSIARSYLVSEVRSGINQLRSNLGSAARHARVAAAAARHAPDILGEDGARRYLLVVQNPAELRGTGGLIGNWGILTAAQGTLSLESMERTRAFNESGRPRERKLHAPRAYVDRYERFDPARNVQNANITPDFPTAAAVMADLYRQGFSAPLDGVLAIDPQGLAALLRITGPVRVTDWPTPVSAANVVDVTLRDAYAVFARTPDRADFLGDVARAAIDRATTGNLGSVEQLSRVLGDAAHQGHFTLWFPDTEEQRIIDDIGISGRLPRARHDTLHVSNTNAGANKLDYYLSRSIDYSVTVAPAPDLRTATVDGTLAVGLENSVPLSGLPQIVAGPFEGATDRFVYGQNYTFLSVYSPLTYTGARVGERAIGLEGARELGRNVYSTFVDVFAQKSTTVGVDLSGTVDLARRGWYRLTVARQPTLSPDEVSIRIAVPSGFRITKARGLDVVDGVAQGNIALDRTRTVEVRIGSADRASIWDRLRRGS